MYNNWAYKIEYLSLCWRILTFLIYSFLWKIFNLHIDISIYLRDKHVNCGILDWSILYAYLKKLR